MSTGHGCLVEEGTPQAVPDIKWSISKGVQIYQKMTTEYTHLAHESFVNP